MPGAVERGAWIIDIDTLERGGEAVRVAFAALLAIGDDIEPGALLVSDSKKCCIVLRLLEKFRSYAPQFPRPHAWREAPGKILPVDQPFRLGVGTNK